MMMTICVWLEIRDGSEGFSAAQNPMGPYAFVPPHRDVDVGDDDFLHQQEGNAPQDVNLSYLLLFVLLQYYYYY